MKTLIFTLLAIGISATCSAQQKQTDKSKLKFAPPVLKKKDETAKTESKEVTRFQPPKLKKNKQSGSKTKKRTEVVKFNPPVLKKDSARKQ